MKNYITLLKRTVILTAFTFTAAGAFCNQSVSTLLEGYLQNDLTLQKLSAEVEKQSLSNQSTAITNGITFTLSTGTITIKSDNSGTSFSLSPRVNLNIPQASNLKVNATSSIQLGNNNSVSDTSINLTADILSSQSAQRQITLLRAQRNYLVARRNLQNRVLSAEKEFYEELKSLYSLASQVSKAEMQLYKDKISFDKVVAQGYRTTSSTYRNSSMSVLSDEHNVENARHELERNVKVFATKCGVEYTESSALLFLPTDIPEVEGLDILSFDQKDYTEIENAQWTHYINSLTRDAQSDISLTGGAGYTFNNSRTNSDSIDGSLNFSLNNTGVSVNAGVSVPLTSNPNPVYTVGIGFDPAALITANLNSQIEELNEQEELISISQAQQNYATTLVSQQTALQDLLWNIQTNNTNLKLYAELAEDMKTYYSQGIVSESEFRSSQVNKENAEIQSTINKIEMIIYNNKVSLLFCRDNELNESGE